MIRTLLMFLVFGALAGAGAFASKAIGNTFLYVGFFAIGIFNAVCVFLYIFYIMNKHKLNE